MSRFAITTKESDALVAAAHLIMRFKISGLPVISNEGTVVGVITATDLFDLMGNDVSQGDGQTEAFSEKLLVRDLMTKHVFTVQENTSLFDIIALMHEKNVHTLPVLNAGAIVGVIGRRDVLHAYYKMQAALEKAV